MGRIAYAAMMSMTMRMCMCTMRMFCCDDSKTLSVDAGCRNNVVMG